MNILTIIKKELKRFFTDKRMLMSLILPGVMIFVLYSIMGNFMGKAMSTSDDYKFKIMIDNIEEHNNLSPVFDEIFKDDTYIIEGLTSLEDAKLLLTNKELDLYITFSDDFVEKSIVYDQVSDPTGELAPKVEMYYNGAKKESQKAYSNYLVVLTLFNDSIAKKFDINPQTDTNYNLASQEEQIAQTLVMIVPFLLIMFLYSGAMSIAIESIAGEKERGTIATLLSTPVKRSDIALGKVISLSIISMVSVVSSFLGLFLSLPKLLQGGENGVSFNIYQFHEYFLLFIVLITTTLIFVALVSLVSAYAKSVKEASSLSSVLMIVSMMVSLPSMLGVSSSSPLMYLIPVYNSVQAITSIMSFEFNLVNFLITIGVNLVVVGGGIYILTRMFNSEKAMFNK